MLSDSPRGCVSAQSAPAYRRKRLGGLLCQQRAMKMLWLHLIWEHLIACSCTLPHRIEFYQSNMGCVPSASFIIAGHTHKVSDVAISAGNVKGHASARTSSSMKITHRDQIKVPLTEKEVFAITKSWKAISRDMTNIGVTMFLRYCNYISSDGPFGQYSHIIWCLHIDFHST